MYFGVNKKLRNMETLLLWAIAHYHDPGRKSLAFMFSQRYFTVFLYVIKSKNPDTVQWCGVNFSKEKSESQTCMLCSLLSLP